MAPPVAAGCGRNSEHPVLRFVPGDPGLRAPCAETHSLPPPERPARRPAPLGIGLASLPRTPRCWWPSPRLDGRLEVCPSQRHGLGALIRPGAETRSSRPCSGPALLPDSVSPARRRDLLRTPCWPGTVRRLPRPPPWSPGDDQWLPGTAGARGRCASVTSYRDTTDLLKFGAAGGQADGSPIMSFKIGKH